MSRMADLLRMMRKQDEERRRREEEEALLIGMTPEEEAAERSTLEHAADLPLQALGLVGGVLDTPGSWVRNLLSGRNPFRGTFDFDRRTTGEEMLEVWGAGKDPGFFPGFAAEVLLDPLTYIPGVGAAGKAAKAAGLAGKGGRGIVKAAARKAKHLDNLADEAATIAQRRAVRDKPHLAFAINKRSLDDIGTTAKSSYLDSLDEPQRLLSNLGEQAKKINDIDGSSGLFGRRQAMDNISLKDMVTFADDPAEAANSVFRAAEGMGHEVGSERFLKMLNDPMGAYHMGLPFSGAGLKVPFTGMKPRFLPEWTRRIPGSQHLSPYTDLAGEAIRYSAPIRFAAEKMSPSAGGFITKEFQREAGPALEEGARLAEQEASKTFTQAARQIGDTKAVRVAERVERGVDKGILNIDLNDPESIRNSVVGVLDNSLQRHLLELGDEGADLVGDLSKLDPDDLRRIGNVREMYGAANKSVLDRARQLGATASELKEFPILHRVPNVGAGPRVAPVFWEPNKGIFGEQDYWARYGTGVQRGRAAQSTAGKILDVDDASFELGRRAELKGVSGSEATIQAILKDPEVDKLRKAIRKINAPGVSRFMPGSPFFDPRGISSRETLESVRQEMSDLIYRKYGVISDPVPVTKTRTRHRLPGAAEGRQTITTTFKPRPVATVNTLGGASTTIQRKSARGFFHNSAEAMGRAADEVGEEAFETVRDQTDAFSRWVEGVTDEQVTKGVFGNAPIVDAKKRHLMGLDSNSAKEVALGMVGRHARQDLPMAKEFVSAGKALKEVGVDLKDADASVVIKEFVGEETRRQISKTLASAGTEATDRNVLNYFADNYRLEKHLGDDLLRVKQAYKTGGDTWNGVVDFVDGYLNMFKANVTGPHAMYQSRNLVSGQMENAISGVFSTRSTNLIGRIISTGDASGIETIPIIRSELKRRGMEMNSDNGLRIFEEIAEQHGVPPDMHIMRDLVGSADSGRGVSNLDPSKNLAGSRRFNILENLPYVGRRWLGVGSRAKAEGLVPAYNPLGPTHVAGASPMRALTPDEIAAREFAESRFPGAGPTRGPVRTSLRRLADKLPWFREATGDSRFAPVAAGQELADAVENMNRMSPFAELLWRGVDPAEAARRIKGIQVDYSNRAFTRFETDVLQRVFPFYKFTRKKGEWVAQTLADKPGGALAQAVRGARLARVEGYAPEHVAETASIPLTGILGPKEAGPGERQAHRYLTSLGFMFEDPIQMLSSDPREMGRELLSRANPLLKYPLEAITGQTFFQKGKQGVGGRPLSDLTPIVPGIFANLGGIPVGDEAVGGLGGPTGREVRKRLADTWPLAGAEHALMNSPYARWVSELRQATANIPPAMQGDTSRLLSYLARTASGMKPTDVQGWQREMVRREKLEQAMRGLGGVEEFQKLYYPKAAFAGMPEEEAAKKLALQDLHASLSKSARARSKARLGDLAKRQEREKELQELLEYLRASRSYQLQGLE